MAASVLAVALGLSIVDAMRIDLDGPAPSYLLLDRHERFIAELGDEETGLGFWPIGDLPPRVVAATLAIEDRRFWQHPGVDPVAIARALLQNARSGARVSGASTLAMQVARLKDPGPRTYWRKLREANRALFLTLRYGREEILRSYLRLVPYGNRVHGIAYAARRYLDKPVGDLSWAEIALLSGIPQAPARMNPFQEDGRRRAVARGKRILAALKDGSVLSPADYDLAMEQIDTLRLPQPVVRRADTLHAVFRLKEALAGRAAVPQREPYRVVTTLDLDLQRKLTDEASTAVSEWQDKGAGNAALVLLDRASNEVLAWVGSVDYFDRAQAGALDYARTPRSPGSVLKPFIYALALERGRITPATILDDLQATPDGISNSDKSYLGPLLPRQALANSRNVPAARLLNDVGIEEGYAFLRELGLHQDEHPARYYGLGLTIGAMPVSLENVVQAYSALANDGRWRTLKWMRAANDQGKRVLTAATARMITLFLSDPIARLPTFPRMGATEYSFPVALKTGTSQGFRDAWTVAYSRRYLLGVWVGHPDARPMNELTGATAAAVLAQRVLVSLHEDERSGLADLAFPPPDKHVPVRVCARSGKRANGVCEPVFEEWFAAGQEPREDDDTAVRLAVDVRNGLLAQRATPKRFVEYRTYLSLAPRYADWASRAGVVPPPREVSMLGADSSVALTRAVAPTPESSVAAFSQRASLRVISPSDGLHMWRDPTLPADRNSVALEVEVDLPVKEVMWTVDGKPYQLAPYPYTVRWPLQAGEHVVQARIPFTDERSAPVRVRVE